MDFDFVIVGGGSSGCVLANRLSEDSSLSIVLIEAGGTDKPLVTRIPAASGKAIFSPKTNWMYMAEPDKTRTGQPEMWPAGKALGGGSSINGMMFVRGNRYDYDLWSQNGAKGWSYDDVLPYFKKLETNERGGGEYRGTSGPLHVSEVRAKNPLTDLWLKAATTIGIKRSPDLNGELAEGVDYVQSTQKNGWRHSAAQAYLWPVADRSNLTIWTHSRVKKIVFEDNCAFGAIVDKDGQEIMVSAKQGVVVTAGSLATPKILKLSGVGPKKELDDHNVDLVADIPAVGENLQEHPAIPIGHHVKIPSIGSHENIFKNLLHGLNFIFRRRGPLTAGVGQAQAFVKTDESYAAPNIQIIMSPFSFVVDEQGPRLYDKAAIGVAVGLTRTEARGQVLLSSSDWDAPPKINYEMLSSSHDVNQLIEGCKIARKISRATPFKEVLKDDREPDESVNTDAEWEAYIRKAAFPMYHPCGTCRIGTDKRAVVDPELKVRGVKNLWVADASVFPTVTAGNINATVIMVAEKAADHIKQALREKNRKG